MPYDGLRGHVYELAVDAALDTLLQQVVSWFGEQSDKASSEAWQGVFLASLIMRCLGAIPLGHWPMNVRDQRLERVVTWADAHPGQSLDNQAMARIAGLSRPAFIRLFRETFGETPQAWLLSRRLQHVCHLLESTDDSIESIASACTFCNRHHLSRMFSREYYIGPAGYRRLHWRG